MYYLRVGLAAMFSVLFVVGARTEEERNKKRNIRIVIDAQGFAPEKAKEMFLLRVLKGGGLLTFQGINVREKDKLNIFEKMEVTKIWLTIDSEATYGDVGAAIMRLSRDIPGNAKVIIYLYPGLVLKQASCCLR